MTFLEKLDMMMADMSINKRKLSQLSGVPYTTIDAFYKKGYENAKISTIRKIAHAFGCSLDYLIEDEEAETQKKALSEKDEALIGLFDKLNVEGQEKLLDYAADLVASGRYIKSSADRLGKEKAQ